jgi:hypothetical protein
MKHPGTCIDFRPQFPKKYRPGIGLIGCGGITAHHLEAYRDAELNVVALCDIRLDTAKKRRDEFYPNADVYGDYYQLLKREDIEVVDIATHPPERADIIQQALEADKHVLSQKPFVVDLDAMKQTSGIESWRSIKMVVGHRIFVSCEMQSRQVSSGRRLPLICLCTGIIHGSKAPRSNTSSTSFCMILRFTGSTCFDVCYRIVNPFVCTLRLLERQTKPSCRNCWGNV